MYALFLFCLLRLDVHADQTVTLAWDANTNASVAGYAVYYGTQSGVYDVRLDAGTNTCLTITNLQAGVTYYFATVDYDTNRVESPLSGEVSFTVPGILQLISASTSDWPATISFPVAPGHWYELQASPDLVIWTTLWQTDVQDDNVWLEFMDFDNLGAPQQYYRLCLH